MTRRLVKGTAATAALIAALAAGYLYRGRAMASPATGGVDPVTAPSVAAPAAATQLPDFSAIVERYGPAVVNVSTTGTVKTSMEGPPLGQLDPEGAADRL